jgi:hypothetical protein
MCLIIDILPAERAVMKEKGIPRVENSSLIDFYYDKEQDHQVIDVGIHSEPSSPQFDRVPKELLLRPN